MLMTPALPPLCVTADPDSQEIASEGVGGGTLEDNLPEHTLQAGCTAVVALMHGDTLVVANAGDSRAVLCRGESAVALSHDHKPAQEDERRRIMAAGGFVSDIGGVVRCGHVTTAARCMSPVGTVQ